MLQHPVGFLKLVPIKQVLLAELKLLQIMLLHDRNAKDVGCGEKPATAGRALVRNWVAFEGNLDVESLVIGESGRSLDEVLERILGNRADREAVLNDVSLSAA